MSESIKNRGRPSLQNPKSNAERQAAYRLRYAAQVDELTKSVTFQYEVFLQINESIKSVKKRFPSGAAGTIAIERKAALYALEDLRDILIKKSNVT